MSERGIPLTTLHAERALIRGEKPLFFQNAFYVSGVFGNYINISTFLREYRSDGRKNIRPMDISRDIRDTRLHSCSDASALTTGRARRVRRIWNFKCACQKKKNKKKERGKNTPSRDNRTCLFLLFIFLPPLFLFLPF